MTARHEVVIVGAGQSGIATAHALGEAGVTGVTVLDAARSERDSPWRTRARMHTLRTPKTLTGPELDNPALSFRTWYENLHGAGTFEGIDRIATTDWADYLDWFRTEVGVPVRRGVRVTGIEPDTAGLQLSLEQDGRRWTETARKVVLATGVTGTGGPDVPAVLRGLPPEVWAHTADAIDFGALHGRTVAVLGAAASAYDVAAAALEAGAAEVHVYTRRPALVVPDRVHRPDPSAQDAFFRLPDAQRWEQRRASAAKGASVPADSVARAAVFGNYRLHVSAPWSAAVVREGRVHVTAADGEAAFDFVIAGTGYQQDPHTRAELAAAAPHIARWRDIYTPPPGAENEKLSVAPYLGPGYQLTEKSHGSAPWLADIHVFSVGANVSFGLPVGDIPSLRSGIPRLVRALTRNPVPAGGPR